MKAFLKKLWVAFLCSIPIIIYISFLVFGVSSMFTSCGKKEQVDLSNSNYDSSNWMYNEAYDEGYNDGYDEGHYNGIYFDWEENICEIATELEYEAVFYAKENGGWHPEEACMIIEAYQNNKPFYQDGSPPSKQDYLDAIDSLKYFYDYFYSARY